ncbi:MAG: HU family DNA-binding protein [Candidatus Sumerlaeia bacterium]|nr:HU family DNA-binding protein [Candidatus Sumerlaeia bacterium]
MTKAEVISAVARRVGLPRKETALVVELFLDSVRSALMKGDKVSLVGFGTFYFRQKRARQARNPRTGAKVHVPRKRVAAFKPGRAFRLLANQPAPPKPQEPEQIQMNT